MHHYVRSSTRRIQDFLVPAAGFAICFVLWCNLNERAKWAGIIWMVIGLAYGAVRTRGFRSELVNFDVPRDIDS